MYLCKVESIKNLLPCIWLVVIIGILYSCASQGSLTGGPRDEIPPVLIANNSTPNFQSNYSDRQFSLEFDEYIKVEDIFNQVVVSPPLIYNPTVVARGKKVRFSFHEDEILRDSTTYTINFGTAIRDLNENNPAEGIRFVFSTGNIIDSLVLEGIITDAVTGSPVSKAVAILYDDPSDSMVIKERPYYFGRTDDNGKFKIENIKAGTYQVVGLKDENQNYKYDDPKELIGYLDSLVTLTQDTVRLKIQVFQERPRYFVQEVDSTQKGLVKIKFNQDLFQPAYERERDDVEILVTHKDATLDLWHKANERLRWWLYIIHPSGSRDSVRIRTNPLDSTLINKDLECMTPVLARNTEHRDSTFYIGFNLPIQSINMEAVQLISDSDSTLSSPVQLVAGTSFPQLEYGFRPVNMSGSFSMTFPPGSIEDFYGRKNTRILKCPVTLLDKVEFSNLTLTIKGFKPDLTYLIRFQFKDKTIREWTVKETESWNGTFLQLKPEKYEVYILEDLNENERWDPGRFLERRQPERKRTEEVSGLRANWDIEHEIDISNWYIDPSAVKSGSFEEDDPDDDREKKKDDTNENGEKN
jgi:hypothetical protein